MVNILAVPLIVVELPYDLEIPILHIHPKKLKASTQINT